MRLALGLSIEGWSRFMISAHCEELYVSLDFGNNRCLDLSSSADIDDSTSAWKFTNIFFLPSARDID